MLGLRNQESTQFNKFFEIVQKEANEIGSVFFLMSEDGNNSIVNDMEVCDLQGWLIPKNKSNDFIPLWEKDDVTDEWSDYFVFSTWKDDNGVKVAFETIPDYDWGF